MLSSWPAQATHRSTALSSVQKSGPISGLVLSRVVSMIWAHATRLLPNMIRTVRLFVGRDNRYDRSISFPQDRCDFEGSRSLCGFFFEPVTFTMPLQSGWRPVAAQCAISQFSANSWVVDPPHNKAKRPVPPKIQLLFAFSTREPSS